MVLTGGSSSLTNIPNSQSDYKGSVRVASTGNVSTASPGSSIDGVTLSNGDRVLLKDQTTSSQNGIWVFNGSASALTRARDADRIRELSAGAKVYVEQGAANAEKTFVLTTTGSITPGTTGLTFKESTLNANPIARFYKDTDASRANNGSGDLGWDVNEYARPATVASSATAGQWSKTTSNTRIYLPAIGYYLVQASIQWGTLANPNTSAGNRQLSINRNGSLIAVDVDQHGDGAQIVQHCHAFIECSIPGTDYVTVTAANSGGGATIGIKAGTEATFLQLVKIA